MSSTWVLDAEATIYTVLEYKTEQKYKTEYPHLYFTRETSNDDLPENQFPTVYVFFSEVETGMDIDNVGINAVEMTMEIQVTTSKSLGLEVAKRLIYYVLDIAKSMRFNTIMMPQITYESSETKVMTCRLRRVVGYDDTILER